MAEQRITTGQPVIDTLQGLAAIERLPETDHTYQEEDLTIECRHQGGRRRRGSLVIDQEVPIVLAMDQASDHDHRLEALLAGVHHYRPDATHAPRLHAIHLFLVVRQCRVVHLYPEARRCRVVH